jgi:hypothetical protein
MFTANPILYVLYTLACAPVRARCYRPAPPAPAENAWSRAWRRHGSELRGGVAAVNGAGGQNCSIVEMNTPLASVLKR